MNMLNKIGPFALAGLLALPGCSEGPPGADGMDGMPGMDGMDGTPGMDGMDGTPGMDGMDGMDVETTSFAGVVSEGAAMGADYLVTLRGVSGNGESGGVLGADVTDASGAFSITQVDVTMPSSNLRYEAYGNGGDFTAIVTDLNQDVTPATTAVDRIITQIASSRGGVAMSDYTGDEIDTSVTEADTALTMAATDLTDPDAVYAQVLADVGEAIADRSGVDPTVSPAELPMPAAPADVRVGNTTTTVDLNNDVEWQIRGNGEIESGSESAFGFAFELQTTSFDQFGFFSAPAPEHQLEDGREVVLGPDVDFAGTGLDATRKIYVPTTGNWARFLEIFDNPTAAPISVSIFLESDLGTGDEIVGPTSSGDMVMDDSDVWVTIDDEDASATGRPALGFYLPGASTVELNSDDVEATWDITVPAGGRVIIVHFAFQALGGMGDVDTIAAQLVALETTAPIAYFEGMTAGELADAVFTFSDNPGNLVGGAGAVAPNAMVTATNLSRSITTMGQAASDGSFTLSLLGASGEMIQLTTGFGRDDTFAIP